MDKDDLPGFVFWFGASEPEARIQWAAPRGVQLDRSQEELIEAIIYGLVEWHLDRTPAGMEIRMLMTLDGVTERVLLEIEEHQLDNTFDNALADEPIRPGFKVRIKRSGIADHQLHIEYGSRYQGGAPTTCKVLAFEPADDE